MRGWALVGVLVASACDSPAATPLDAPGARSQCLDPPRGPATDRFADVTAASGIDFVYAARSFKGGGLAVVDLDGDDRPEIVVGRRADGLALYRNRGGLVWELDSASGIETATAATAFAAADLDNDGDRDLVIAREGETVAFANDGTGRFVETARFAGSGTTEHLLPVDLDNDGYLELYASNYDDRSSAATQNRVYSNTAGTLAFADLAGTGFSWTATAFDVDGDGDQDLYVANDTLLADYGNGPVAESPWPVDLVLRNDGMVDGKPVFVDIAADLGLTTPRSSMGGTLADFDGDGQLDLFVPDLGANKLFVRGPDNGPFVDRARELGVSGIARTNELCDGTPQHEGCLVMHWSVTATDFDHDGYDELLVINGETSPEDHPPVHLFERRSAPAYREVSPAMPCMDARGHVATDLDGDGDQDVVIAQQDGPLLVYENVGTPAPGSWLRVTLRGRGAAASNRDGIGAVVTLTMASGRTQMRVVGHGGVLDTASPPEAFFGLGGDRATAIDVTWPSGKRSTLAMPPGPSVMLEEPS